MPLSVNNVAARQIQQELEDDDFDGNLVRTVANMRRRRFSDNALDHFLQRRYGLPRSHRTEIIKKAKALLSKNRRELVSGI